jgi:hypothetical protein
MHANSEAHPLAIGDVGRGFAKFRLHLQSGRYCPNRRFEDRQDGVPGHVDDTTLVFFDQFPKHVARSVECHHSCVLIGGHQTRIACRVRRKDGCQALPVFDATHRCWPSRRLFANGCYRNRALEWRF